MLPVLRDVLARTATRATLSAECCKPQYEDAGESVVPLRVDELSSNPGKYVLGILQAEETSILMLNKLGEAMRDKLLPRCYSLQCYFSQYQPPRWMEAQ